MGGAWTPAGSSSAARAADGQRKFNTKALRACSFLRPPSAIPPRPPVDRIRLSTTRVGGEIVGVSWESSRALNRRRSRNGVAGLLPRPPFPITGIGSTAVATYDECVQSLQHARNLLIRLCDEAARDDRPSLEGNEDLWRIIAHLTDVYHELVDDPRGDAGGSTRQLRPVRRGQHHPG